MCSAILMRIWLMRLDARLGAPRRRVAAARARPVAAEDAGAAAAGGGAVAARVRRRCAAGAGPCAMYASTSCLVMRPPAPVPFTG